jgi:hypothetical protein
MEEHNMELKYKIKYKCVHFHVESMSAFEMKPVWGMFWAKE